MSDSENPRVDRSGIFIERDLADSVAIEEELDSSVLEPFRFPSPERRRTAGWIFLVAALIVALTVDGGWVPAIGMLVLAGWQFASAWPLNLDERDALEEASQAVAFPVGHASAAVTFKGLRSRPRWAVILYSAHEPPDERALVVVDAVAGGIVEEVYVESIPEV
jgi:hypothetical protein